MSKAWIPWLLLWGLACAGCMRTGFSSDTLGPEHNSDTNLSGGDPAGSDDGYNGGGDSNAGDSAADDGDSPPDSGDSASDVDASALEALINNAQNEHEGASYGTQTGQYPGSASDSLEASINTASDVLSDPDANQEDVDNARAALVDAIADFHNRRIFRVHTSGKWNYHYFETQHATGWDVLSELEAVGHDMYVKSNIEYIGGSYRNGGVVTACYWTNRVVSADLGEGEILGIFVDDSGQVHKAGYFEDRAAYWNASDSVQQLSTQTSEASDIFVTSTGDVYISGWYDDGTSLVACYWLNGSRTDLAGVAGQDSAATAILVDDNQVYVSGWYNDGTRDTGCYWRDGARVDLAHADQVSFPNTRADDLFIDADANVYVAGMGALSIGIYANGDHWIYESRQAFYWVNDSSSITTMFLESDQSDPFAKKIIAFRGVVYVLGSTYDTGDNYADSCFWTDDGGVQSQTHYNIFRTPSSNDWGFALFIDPDGAF